MRAVVLSDRRNIEFINENFISTWVLNLDLQRLHDVQGMDAMHPLARNVIRGWKKNSPVDSLIISPGLEIIGRQPVNEIILSKDPKIWAEAYHTFLVKALAGKLPGWREDDTR